MIEYRDSKDLPYTQVMALYQANEWSAANKPDALCAALQNSHTVITAWDDIQLVGLANAISDGYLVVYYPHLLVMPDYQGQGIGRRIMELMHQRYGHFHQQILVAERAAVGFYQKCGLAIAGKTQSMWIYDGDEH